MNPAHLSWGTNRRNVLEARDRLRIGLQKLTRPQAHAIKFRESGAPKDIARRYGVTRSVVYQIRGGHRWSDLREEEYQSALK